MPTQPFEFVTDTVYDPAVLIVSESLPPKVAVPEFRNQA